MANASRMSVPNVYVGTYEDPWESDEPISFTSKRRISHVKKERQGARLRQLLGVSPRGGAHGGSSAFTRKYSKVEEVEEGSELQKMSSGLQAGIKGKTPHIDDDKPESPSKS
jgi:hypothetical protein